MSVRGLQKFLIEMSIKSEKSEFDRQLEYSRIKNRSKWTNFIALRAHFGKINLKNNIQSTIRPNFHPLLNLSQKTLSTCPASLKSSQPSSQESWRSYQSLSFRNCWLRCLKSYADTLRLQAWRKIIQDSESFKYFVRKRCPLFHSSSKGCIGFFYHSTKTQTKISDLLLTHLPG